MNEIWRTFAICDVANVINGGTPKTRITEYWGGSCLWITPAEMGNRKTPYISESRRTLTEFGLSNCSATAVPAKSVILSTRAPIGHLVINTKSMAFNQGCRGIVPNEQLSYKFLYYFLLGNIDLLNDLGSGTTFKELAAGKLKKVQIPLPPLPEQKRIVEILDDAFAAIDQAIANTEKNLANARELFDSHLNAAFSQQGEGWVNKRLSELIDITHGFAFKGTDFSPSNDESKPIVLTPGNYTEDARINFTTSNTKRFFGEVPKDYLFEENSLTVVMTDLSSKMKILGKPAFVHRPNVLHNQRVGRVLFLDKSVSPPFLYYFLRTGIASNEIKRTATGTMVRHTAPKRILSLNLAFPPNKAEQRTIISSLNRLVSETRYLESNYTQKLTALTELKQSLLQKAFAGELTADNAARDMA